MRYLVVGTSGVGKSTFAEKLAAKTRCPFVELDSYYWGPDWQAVPPELFKRSVVQATQGACWVADGNYSAVRDVLWSIAIHGYRLTRVQADTIEKQVTDVVKDWQVRADHLGMPRFEVQQMTKVFLSGLP